MQTRPTLSSNRPIGQRSADALAMARSGLVDFRTVRSAKAAAVEQARIDAENAEAAAAAARLARLAALAPKAAPRPIELRFDVVRVIYDAEGEQVGRGLVADVSSYLLKAPRRTLGSLEGIECSVEHGAEGFATIARAFKACSQETPGRTPTGGFVSYALDGDALDAWMSQHRPDVVANRYVY